MVWERASALLSALLNHPGDELGQDRLVVEEVLSPSLQGYLAHEKHPPPMTLQQGYT